MDQTDDGAPQRPIFKDEAFASFADLIQLLADPVQFNAAIARCRAAIDAAKATIADVRAQSAAIAPVNERLDDYNALIERWKAAKKAVVDLELDKRRQRINTLVQSWRLFGEKDLVLQGIQAPEFQPLEKARSYYGLPPLPKENLFGFAPDTAPLTMPADHWQDGVTIGQPEPAPYSPSTFRLESIALPTDITVVRRVKVNRRRHRTSRKET
jgi:hypothetical protein